MEAKSQRHKGQDSAISALNGAIEALTLAKEVSSIPLANKIDYVELGLACADVCIALDRGLNGKMLNDLNNSVCEAINQLTT